KMFVVALIDTGSVVEIVVPSSETWLSPSVVEDVARGILLVVRPEMPPLETAHTNADPFHWITFVLEHPVVSTSGFAARKSPEGICCICPFTRTSGRRAVATATSYRGADIHRMTATGHTARPMPMAAMTAIRRQCHRDRSCSTSGSIRVQSAAG